MNKIIKMLTIATATVIGMNSDLLAADVAQIGETRYESINEAFYDAAYVLEGDIVEIKLLADVTEPLTADYLFGNNVVLTTEVENGVTVDLGYERGGSIHALIALDSNTLAVADGVSIIGLGQLFSGFGTEGDVVEIDGGVMAREIWVYGGTFNVNASAAVVSDYGTGLVKLYGECEMNVTGQGQEAVQFAAECIKCEKNGTKALNLANTYMTAEWLANYGDADFALNLDNAKLELNCELDLGAGTLNLKGNSLVIASGIYNASAINIDMTGVAGPVKVIDCTGYGEMTLSDYGAVSVIGGAATVIDSDLWVYDGSDETLAALRSECEAASAYVYSEEELEEFRSVADFIAECGNDCGSFTNKNLNLVKFIDWINSCEFESVEEFLATPYLYEAYAFNLPFDTFAEAEPKLMLDIRHETPETGYTTIIMYVKAGEQVLELNSINADVFLYFGQKLDAMEEFLVPEDYAEFGKDEAGHSCATIVIGPPEGASAYFKVSVR